MKLIFVVVLEAGRVRAVDLATVSLMLKRIEDVGVDASGLFSVIVNKCVARLMQDFAMMRPREQVRSAFGTKNYLPNMEFFPEIAAADDQKDYLHHDNSRYISFLRYAPTMSFRQNTQMSGRQALW